MIEQPCHQCNTALHLKKNGCMVSITGARYLSWTFEKGCPKI